LRNLLERAKNFVGVVKGFVCCCEVNGNKEEKSTEKRNIDEKLFQKETLQVFISLL